MKNFISLLLILSFITPQFAFSSDVPITIQEIGLKVKKQNILVLQEAERVYQAKESIKFARANLLPKLNLWRLISAVASFPMGLLGLLEDMVPFLVPNNWLRLKQQSLFYQAELQASQALKANQVFNAKSLYFDSLSDLALYNLISDSLKSTKDVLDYVKVQEAFGQAPQGASELLQIKVLAFEDDLKSLEQLLYAEKQALSQLAGLSAKDLIKLVPVSESVPSKPLDAATIEKIAIDKSPELKQFDFLIDASRYVKREAYFSILGVSSMTRGAAGGIFDSIPVQDGLGFGMGPSIRIGRSYTQMIGLQKEGAQQTLSRQVQTMVMSFNLDLDRYINAGKRLDYANRLYSLHRQRLQGGQAVPPLELIEALQQMLIAKTDTLVVETRMRQTVEKSLRLKLETADYEELGEINEPNENNLN